MSKTRDMCKEKGRKFSAGRGSIIFGGGVMLILLLGSEMTAGLAPAKEQDKTPTEYELKAVCIYNFLRYTDWPKETPDPEKKEEKAPEPIVIGVVGKDPFGKSLNLIESKKVGEQKIVVKKFGDFDNLNITPTGKPGEYSFEDLQKCRVLFVSTSETKNLKRIFQVVQKNSVMTVGETGGFLEAGGVINFVMEDNKVRFEINLDTAKEAQLQIKTTVLKLAKRVLQKKK